MTKLERSFEEWANTLTKKHRLVLYENGPIPILSQIYFILLDNIMYNNQDCNPTTLEIVNWIEIGKVSEGKITRQVENKNIVYQKSMVIAPLQLVI